MSERYLSTGQAAGICSVSPDTILKWIRSGKLPARKTAGGQQMSKMHMQVNVCIQFDHQV